MQGNISIYSNDDIIGLVVVVRAGMYLYDRKVVSSNMHAPMELLLPHHHTYACCNWCEKSIQHHPSHQYTQLQMGTWNFSGGANYLVIFHIPAQVGLPLSTMSH